MKLPSEIIREEQNATSVSTTRRRAQEWFNDTYINEVLEPKEAYEDITLEVGKMYSYWYDPYYADKLPFFDNFPVMLCLGHLETKKRINAFGINISYLPPEWRIQIFDKIFKMFGNRYLKYNKDIINKGRPTQQKVTPMYYDVMKQILEGSGFEFALRSYRYDRFMSVPKIITIEDWWKPLLFPSNYIFKLNVRAIYAKYKQNVDDTYKGIGSKDPKVNIRKTKVKDINAYIKNREKL